MLVVQPKPRNRPTFVNLQGRLFGLLFVAAYLGQSRWLCTCRCGGTAIRGSGSLVRGDTLSCGCRVKPTQLQATHGLSKTVEYQIYHGMIRRCYDSSREAYKHYGKLGITVCDRWLTSFEAFFADMGLRPSPKLSLDRIDSSGNYEPSNCRWATSKEQNRNTRTNIRLTLNGKTKTVAEWARSSKVKAATLRLRKIAGWCDGCSLTIPAHRGRCEHR